MIINNYFCYSLQETILKQRTATMSIYVQDFATLSAILQDPGTTIFFKGFYLMDLFYIATTDPWPFTVPSGTLRGATFSLKAMKPGVCTIDIKKTRDDEATAMDLGDERLTNRDFVFTWESVLADEKHNLLHFVLFSIASNIGPMEVVRDNWQVIDSIIQGTLEGEENYWWYAIAHFAYIVDDWQHGKEDVVFQQVASNMSKNGTHQLLEMEGDKYKLKESTTLEMLLNDPHAVASYTAAFMHGSMGGPFKHLFEMDAFKAQQYMKLVESEKAKKLGEEQSALAQVADEAQEVLGKLEAFRTTATQLQLPPELGTQVLALKETLARL